MSEIGPKPPRVSRARRIPGRIGWVPGVLALAALLTATVLSWPTLLSLLGFGPPAPLQIGEHERARLLDAAIERMSEEVWNADHAEPPATVASSGALTGRLDEAIRTIAGADLVEARPCPSTERVVSALTGLSSGRVIEAAGVLHTIAEARQSAGEKPQAVDALLQLAALSRSHDSIARLDALRRAVDLDPESPWAWHAIHELAGRLGLRRVSEHALERASALVVGGEDWALQLSVALAHANALVDAGEFGAAAEAAWDVADRAHDLHAKGKIDRRTASAAIGQAALLVARWRPAEEDRAVEASRVAHRLWGDPEELPGEGAERIEAMESLRLHGRVLLFAGRAGEARPLVELALQTHREAADPAMRDRHLHDHLLASSMTMVRILVELEEVEAARELHLKATNLVLGRLDALMRRGSSILERDADLDALDGRLSGLEGRPESAVSRFRLEAEQRERLHNRQPWSAAAADALLDCRIRLFEALLGTEDLEAARGAGSAAASLAQDLEAQGVLAPRRAAAVGRLRAALEKLDAGG